MTFLLHDTASGLTTHERAYAESKLSRLTQILPGLRSVQLVHRHDRNDHSAELHLVSDGVVLRICGKAKSIRDAIDLAHGKAVNKLRKLRERSQFRRK